MSSTTSSSEFLSTPGLHWPSRIFRLRRIGRPASWSVESWRVKVQSCLADSLPMVNDFFFRRPTAFLARPGPFLSLAPLVRSAILVTKNPFWRISCCASSCVEASMVSLTSLPVWSIASYWNVGIARLLRHWTGCPYYLGRRARARVPLPLGTQARALRVGSRSGVLEHRLADDLLDGGLALVDGLQAGLAEGAHAE